MNNYFYLDNNNQQKGPISPMQFAMYGVNAKTMVWCTGMADWQRAGDIEELRDFITTAYNHADSTPPRSNAASTQQSNYQQAGNYANGSTQQQQFMPPCPPSHLVWAILTTIFCCMPTGIVAIIYASKVSDRYVMGNMAGAIEASKKAKNWSIYGVIASIIISILYAIFFVSMTGVAALASGTDF